MTRFLFADWNDPDAPALVDKAGLTWVKLAQNTDSYTFHLTGGTGSWTLSHEGGVVTSELLAAAERVVMRRWRSSPPAPIIQSSANDKMTKEFIERQWEATLLAALQMAYLSRPDIWSRSPIHQDFKVLAIQLIQDLVLVPAFEVADLPRGEHLPLVAKSIHVDQSFGPGRVSTVPVDLADLVTSQPSPMVFQQRIQASEEWRLAYSYGQVGIVQQFFPTAGVVDRRFSPPASRRSHVCDQTADEARRVSKALGLNMFTADILVDGSRARYWCDINPDGLFGVADAPDYPLQTALIEGVR
ncbi:hypothetical protein [Arthrobacter humicola]